MVLMSGVLGLLLVGILVYAVVNQGAGFIDPLDKADQSVSDVQKYDKLDRDHVATTVDYSQSPPVGGKHAGAWENCAVYTKAIASENAVHSLEHGAVWVTYRPDLAAAQVAALAAKVEGNPYRLMSPYPGLKSPISLQAWGRQIFADSPTDKKVDAFLEAYTQGPQAPEKGTCDGGTSATGPLQVAPAAPASGAASPAASAHASPAASGHASPVASP
ncbi:MAG: DUF3105 domain-containing protein [Frankiaceae bacterium]|nr:DUF3105 domain-containing protein [Frankiaceae bacterium]